MKTHLFFIGAVALLGTSLLTTSYAANTSEYLHLTRHRDSNGNLLMAPRQHKAEPSVMQKMVMPSQLKTFERQSTDWGMSVQEVKENEPIQSSWDLQMPVLAAYEKRVAYHTQIEGIAAALTYTFYDNHLGQAKYVFEPQHKDAVEYVQDFRTVKNWISQSYGSPIHGQEIWLDTLYQYDQSLWGQAVKRGHLVMVAEWKNPGTDIVLVLDGGNDEVGLIADFSSTTFVVPVSLDLQSQEESVEEVIEETTAHEAVLPTEQNTDLMTEEISIQETLIDETGIEKHSSDTEVASQTQTELDEIERMLNEEFPELEPLEPTPVAPFMEEEGHERTHDAQASIHMDELAPEALDHQPLTPEPTHIEGVMEDYPIEPSLEGHEGIHDPQASIHMDELASDSLDHQSVLPASTQREGVMEDYAIEPSLEGHERTHDAQASIHMDELDHQPLTPEPTQVEETMKDHSGEPGNYLQTSEYSISNASENVAEGLEEMTSEHATHGDSVDDHFMEDHANDHAIQSEAESEGLHL